MIRVYPRSTLDVSYFTNDHALELEGLRRGPAGRWLSGSGDVTNESVGRILTPTARSATVGYDLVVAAPRPLSILIALDPEHAPAIVAAHQEAVAHSIDYLNERAVVIRDRRFGGDYEDVASWGPRVAFTHGVNRHGEPHLHDHVLVGSQPLGAPGVLDRRALGAHVLAADALYGAHLRNQVGRTTPWKPWRSFQGTDHVAGVDEGYRALWGGHFDDRPAKQQWRRSEIVDRWQSDLDRYIPIATIAPTPRSSRTLDEHRFSASLEGLENVTRRDLILAWANAAPWGIPAPEVERAIDIHYPSLEFSRGLREETISVRAARQTQLVRERGERPLDVDEVSEWFQRSRSRPVTSFERSR